MSTTISHAACEIVASMDTASDAQLLGASDEEQLAYSFRENRVFYTNDADFLRLAAEGREHAGICYCRPQSRTTGQIIRALALIHDRISESVMIGRVEYL